MMSSVRGTTRTKDATFAAQTNVASSKVQPVSDREAAEKFSATIIAFSAGDLAKAAHRTKAAAKGWKDASRAPSAASLINLAREIPAVKKWLLSEIDLGRTSEFDGDPRNIDAIVRATIAAMDRRGE